MLHSFRVRPSLANSMANVTWSRVQCAAGLWSQWGKVARDRVVEVGLGVRPPWRFSDRCHGNLRYLALFVLNYASKHTKC